MLRDLQTAVCEFPRVIAIAVVPLHSRPSRLRTIFSGFFNLPWRTRICTFCKRLVDPLHGLGPLTLFVGSAFVAVDDEYPHAIAITLTSWTRVRGGSFFSRA